MTNEELSSLPIGAKIRVKPWKKIEPIVSQLDWINEKKPYCGKELTISIHCSTNGKYGARVHVKEDNESYYWYASMLEEIAHPLITSDNFFKIIQ